MQTLEQEKLLSKQMVQNEFTRKRTKENACLLINFRQCRG